MPSVNPIPFSEPRQQPTSRQQAPGGDPFAELLGSAVREKPAARREPAAAKSRGETRAESLSRRDVKEAKTVSARRETAGTASKADAGAPAKQTMKAADQPQTTAGETEGSEPVAGRTAELPMEIEAEADAAKPAIDGETVEPAVQAAADIPADAADETVKAETADASTAAVVAADAVAAPATEPLQIAEGTTPPQVAEGATSAESETPAEDGQIAAPAPATSAADAPAEAATGEALRQAAQPAAQSADNKPAPTPATAGTETPEIVAPAPAPTRTAASGEPQQNQPAPQANSQPAAEQFSNLLQGEGGDASSQKQPDTSANQTKPQDAKPATTAEAPKASAPAQDAPAPKMQPQALPEAVRVVTNSLNTANVQTVNFHATAVNDRAPVPLNNTALAVEIVSRMNEGMRRFDIRLDPPELGRVDVRLEVDRNGNVTTKLTVDRPETLDLMQRDARHLERALQQAGLKTDGGGLEFSLRSHADQGGMAGGHADRGGRERGMTGGEDVERVELSVEAYRSAAHARGGVDIRI